MAAEAVVPSAFFLQQQITKTIDGYRPIGGYESSR